MTNKKLIYLTLIISILTLVIAFFVSRVEKDKLSDDTLSLIQNTGKVNICYGVYPPGVIRDSKTGELSGHDIDTIKYIFGQIKVKPVFIEQAWGNMASALQSGRCDIAVAIFAQIPRAAAVSFSRPMYFIGEGILAHAGEKRFKTIADIDSKGIKIAVANGESGHNFSKEHFNKAELITIDIEGSDLSRMFSEVSSGRADVAVADTVNIARYAQSHSETIDLFNEKPVGLNPVSLAVRISDKNLLQFLNTSLDVMDLNGKIDELQKKYDAHWLHEIKSYQIK